MSALDKVFDFSIDDWTDAQRASKSPQARLVKQASAELEAMRTALDAAKAINLKFQQYGLLADKYITLGELENLSAALAKLEQVSR